MPAWQSVKESLSAGMHRERKQRVRRILVVAQIAVSFVVLAAAALFFENLVRSHSMGPGFDIRRTLRAEIYLPPGTYQESRSINSYKADARRAAGHSRGEKRGGGGALSRSPITTIFYHRSTFRTRVRRCWPDSVGMR